MAFFTGSEVRGRLLRIIASAGLILHFFSTVCTVSTLPVQPSLLFEISNPSSDQNATLTFLITWNGYGSFNKPPEQIIVDVFSVPDGSRLGSFPIPKIEDVCMSENTCMYYTSIEVAAFPSGTFILIAEDPLSGANNRQMISIPLYSKGNIQFFRRFEHKQIFSVISVILGVFLVFFLAILVREKI